ncbi:hypothetical protein Pan241w_59090 [Gimesia alba]|uniref:Uncharacterized protein n=1 Tax=Gimesia alba TaxID=2527973 RepID=A0A517RPG8_9PLAN|nr:hypothetical protein [Gimesia alba]QDT45781.1 hypothetical protein Pan241w_59090 [Gimesia alba]
MKIKTRNFKLKWIIYFSVVSFVFPQFVEAIEIHNIRWGFNNRPVAYKINPVTLLVENTSPTPFEGEIKFQQESFRGQRIGITLSAATYIAPFEKKSLQFYPYITESANNWEASWEENNDQQTQLFLAPRPATDNALIQLVQPDSLDRIIPGIKQYPEDLFPPLLGAVDSLDGIILDHVPKWEKSRRTTFLQWIFAGGIVHVFENSNGDLPIFPESYSPLNGISTPVFYGNGAVYRYQDKLSDLTASDLKQLMAGNTRVSTLLSNTEENTSSQAVDSKNIKVSEALTYFSMASDEEILATLTEISKPKQIWYFIFLLSFFYLIVAGPGYYLVTKLSKKHSTYYGVYLTGTILFCLTFLLIGHYSTNRTSQIHSLVVANIMPDNEIDLTSWASLGVVSGGNFNITYTGDAHIYSACQPYSKVNGIVTCGAEGYMQVDIPPNSSCAVFHRGKTLETSFDVKVSTFLKNETGVEKISLEIDNNFPLQVEQVYFLFGAKLYELKKENERLEYQGTSKNLFSILNTNPLLEINYFRPNRLFPFINPKHQKNNFALKKFFPILLQRAMRLSAKEINRRYRYPDNRGRLFVLSKTPDNLFPKTPEISRKNGLVLYSLEVPFSDQTD